MGSVGFDPWVGLPSFYSTAQFLEAQDFCIWTRPFWLLQRHSCQYRRTGTFLISLLNLYLLEVVYGSPFVFMHRALHTVLHCCSGWLFSCSVNNWTQGVMYTRQVLWVAPALRWLFELTGQSKVLFKKKYSSDKTMIMSLTASKTFVSIFSAKGGALSFHTLGMGSNTTAFLAPLPQSFWIWLALLTGKWAAYYSERGQQSGGTCLSSEKRVRPG